MLNSLKKMLAGRSLPSLKAWTSVDWDKKQILFALCFAFGLAPLHAMELEGMVEYRIYSQKELEQLIKRGVNGILSDFPAVMNAILGDMRKARGL